MRRTTRLFFAGLLLAAGPIGSEEAPPPEKHLSLEVPETREQHQLMAAEYRRRAAQLRLDAEMHRGMKESYSQALAARRPSASLKRWWAKQRPHCDRLIHDAEKLATEMEGFSEFHAREAAGTGGE